MALKALIFAARAMASITTNATPERWRRWLIQKRIEGALNRRNRLFRAHPEPLALHPVGLEVSMRLAFNFPCVVCLDLKRLRNLQRVGVTGDQAAETRTGVSGDADLAHAASRRDDVDIHGRHPLASAIMQSSV